VADSCCRLADGQECYDAVRVAELLGRSTPRLHFDEAWFPYARFHPLYARRYGMAVDKHALPDDERPTVFASQSSHKLLAALSQSAMIHVKESPRAPFDPAHWHGFPDIEPGFCMLDPIKVTVTCPGVDARGRLTQLGIPARVVTAYLETRRIVVEKTDTYTFLVLFSMGITKGKWGTMLDALTDFKHLYDNDAPLADVLPALVRDHSSRYSGLTLPQLCDQIHRYLIEGRLVTLLNEAFTDPTPPEAVLTPAQAYQQMVCGRTELVQLDELADRVVATQVTTTPPGIPVLMPGERTGTAEGPLLRYLRLLESFDREFPGFASETHGIHRDADGYYWLACVQERLRRRRVRSWAILRRCRRKGAALGDSRPGSPRSRPRPHRRSPRDPPMPAR
jgi:arginine/lysine/ornithine decarboxylase